jgi:DNA-binding NtrC family response regulator
MCNATSQRSEQRTVMTLIASILIVDDDAGIRNMLSVVLNDEGYSVETAENGKQAIKMCEKTPFDVALIDIQLPDIKGTELLARLKRIRPGMIRIIITGHPTLETAMKSVNERADGYVQKPFEVTELLEKISRLLTGKTDEYMRISAETTREREGSPRVKYNSPDKW